MTSFYQLHRNHILTLIAFSFLSVWWIVIQQASFSETDRQVFSAVYGLMALWGGIWGLRASHEWGGRKSLFGQAILFFSFGLLAQEFGQLTYSFYANVLHVEIPYPSLGDLGYFGSIPLYAYGAWLLARTSGIKFNLRSHWGKMSVVFLPVVLLAISYALFLRQYEFDWSAPLVIALDFGYPLGQAIYISIAILTYLLCGKMLGGVMRSRVMLLIAAFMLQYAADFTFLYQNSVGTWEGGRLNDYMYLIAYTAMTLALLELRVVYLRLQKTG